MNSSEYMLLSAAFLLGIRHGFDLDHLATIDSATRTISKSHKRGSRMVGCLFSLGHGSVVTAISLIVGSGMMRSHTPEWLDDFGSWVSIIFLFVFGILTLCNVSNTTSKPGLPTSVKGYLLNGRTLHPAWVVLIGALFAFSFDTFSQVALFALSANAVAGYLFSGLLGIIFMLGMMLSDGLNGFLVSLLLQRADRLSTILSRSAGLVIATFSLLVGTINLSKMVL